MQSVRWSRKRAMGAAPFGGRRSKRGDLRRGLTLGLKIVAALLSLTVFVTTCAAWASYRSFLSNVTTVDVIAKPKPDQPTLPDVDGVSQNILLVGNDDRTGASPAELAEMHTAEDDGGVNTDTMLLLHIPADGSRATGISFPRDSWVDVPGLGLSKLNAAYEYGTRNGAGAAGGAKLLIDMIQQITGLHIDHYVAVSMIGFLRIATVLGPIQVCLNEAVDDPYSGAVFNKGINTLNPSEALSFVRQRHDLPDGDLDREVRQQYFLSTEFRKLSQGGALLHLGTVQRLLKAISSSIVTDPGLNLLTFAAQVKDLSAGNVTFATLPITGTPDIYPGGVLTSVVSLDWAAIPGFIANVVGSTPAYLRAVPVTPQGIAVDVVNASDGDGTATSAAAALTRLGFVATADPTHFVTQDSDPSNITTKTSIAYPPGMEVQAKTLAGAIPGALVASSTSVKVLTVLIGTDDRGIAAPVANPLTSSSVNPTTKATLTDPASALPPASASQPAIVPSGASRGYSSADCIN